MMTLSDVPTLERLAAMVRELEADLERLAERLNRLEHSR
jgi:ubiquinone biosynthesis protein UbiJ